MGIKIRAEVVRGKETLGVGEVVIKDGVIIEDIMELVDNPELWEKVIVNGKEIKLNDVIETDYDGGLIVYIN